MAAYVYAGAAGWVGAPKGIPTRGLFRAGAGDDRWDSLTSGLPEAVEVRALTVRPAAPNVVYAGTQAGPYVSEDAGGSWRALPLPGSNRVVWSILLHPSEPGTLYVGTEGTGIYRSRDHGASWRELAVPAPEGMLRMDFPARVVRLALDPSNPDEIYAGLEVGGVVRSTDGGDSWQSCNAGLLAFAKQDRFKSRIGTDSDSEGMLDSHALTLSPARAGEVVLANRMGLFRSADRGRNWADMQVGRHSPLTYARDVRVSRHDVNTLYAALSVAAISDAGSLYRSRDLGASWQRFDHDVSIESTLMIAAEGATDPDLIYCAARRGQVFGTVDGGKTWRASRLPGGVQGIYALAAA